jgi:hypothetical protein
VREDYDLGGSVVDRGVSPMVPSRCVSNFKVGKVSSSSQVLRRTQDNLAVGGIAVGVGDGGS